MISSMTSRLFDRIQKEFSQETVPRRLLTVQNEQQKQELERLCLAELLGKGSCLDKVRSSDPCKALLNQSLLLSFNHRY